MQKEAKEQQRIEDRTWTEAGKEALVNIPKSALGLAKNIGSAIINPIDTLEGVADVVTGYGLDNNVFGLGDSFNAKTQRNIEQIDKRIAQAQAKGNLKRVKELQEVKRHAIDLNLPWSEVSDAGHTQLEPGTTTCISIGPAPENLIDKITGNLKLL